VVAHPEVLVQLRNVNPDAEGFNVHRGNTEASVVEDVGPVSPQAVACRKRCVVELGKPRKAPGMECRSRNAVIEARRETRNRVRP
jgi:hypothetical protein